MSNAKTNTATYAWITGMAGLAWILSGALHGWFMTHSALLPAPFVRLIFPETIALGVWRSAEPWQIVVPALSTLALMLFTALALSFAGSPEAEQPAQRRIRFLARWMAVVLASVATTVISSAGEILATWPPPRMAMFFQSVESGLLSAGYWGVFWGWIPVLAGSIIASKRLAGDRLLPSVRLPQNFLIASTAVLALVLVFSIQQARNETESLAASAQPDPEPVNTPEPVIYGSPSISQSYQPAGTNWCDGKAVEITWSQPEAATGHRAMGITLTNAGSAPCVLESYPDIAFDNVDGWAMDVFVVHGGSFMTDDPGVKPMTVNPGQSAQAVMGWDAMAAAGDTRVGTMLVAPYAGTLRQDSEVDLDIIDGGTVSVTAWEPMRKTP